MAAQTGTRSYKITLANLKTVAKELGESMTDEELQDMIDHADKSSTNAVSFDDFYRLMGAKRNAPQSAIDVRRPARRRRLDAVKILWSCHMRV